MALPRIETLRHASWQAIAGLLLVPALSAAFGEVIDFNHDWRFHLGAHSGASYANHDDSDWEKVALPHTPKIEALVTGSQGPASRQWQGLCWYRKSFDLEEDVQDRLVLLEFEGAMGVADVWLNDQLLTRHTGGYLPIVLDITDRLHRKAPNVLSVRLDNHDNGIIGPKPLAHLDFNFYGGLYRGVRLIIEDRLHITDPILADHTASGGVFITFPTVTDKLAIARAQTHVANRYPIPHRVTVRTAIFDAAGVEVASDTSQPVTLDGHHDTTVVQHLRLNNPSLWSPDSPNLYRVRTELIADGKVYDVQETPVGARHIHITKNGLWLNRKKTFLRGTNRHQEYPYIGYALSANAQFRDAKKIKDAGFDFVRLSHYPHAPAFLDACDQLGLMVMDCIMGWQYFSDLKDFKAHQYRQSRELIRRDRNHPCVLLWEVSLNESAMTEEFMKATHDIAHQEYPGDQCFSCGWDGDYDVFIQARQHGGCRNVTDRPCMISEYGDWEYYAQNAGLQQDLWQDLSREERNSRQDRTDGERRLLQQAINFQEAHNDNRKTNAFADGLWVMFDYNRGYSDDLEKSGCMDVFRLPKPSYYFFKSQRSPLITGAPSASGAFVHIASRWTEQSPLPLKVYSNCEEVALYVNDELIARQVPDDDRLSTHLGQPPFTFSIDSFSPGVIHAIGFVEGVQVCEQTVRTPGQASQILMSVDLSGREIEASENDAVFIHAHLADPHKVTTTGTSAMVRFQLRGDGELIGENPTPARAGIASILYRSGSQPGAVKIVATSSGLQRGEFTINVIERQSRRLSSFIID